MKYVIFLFLMAVLLGCFSSPVEQAYAEPPAVIAEVVKDSIGYPFTGHKYEVTYVNGKLKSRVEHKYLNGKYLGYDKYNSIGSRVQAMEVTYKGDSTIYKIVGEE